MRTRVVIAHCDGRVRAALCALIDPRCHEAVAEQPRAAAVLELLEREPAAALLIDPSSLSQLPETPVLRGTPTVVVAEHAAQDALELAIDRGCAAYLVFPCTRAQLQASLALSCARGGLGARDAATSGTHAIELPRGAAQPGQPLSVREQEVCDYLRAGHRVSDVAARLYISPHTVRKHAQAVFRKLGVHSQIELMRHYAPRRRRTPT
jgi:DNA-binding NarL/FixJ family response regulator